MKIYIALLFLSIYPTLSLAESCNHSENEFRCVQYVRNYDADTITFNIPGLHPIVGKNMNIRVKGVDTPEIRTKDKCEKEKARHAKKLVKSLLKVAKRIDLIGVEKGKYFRFVAEVWIDGKELTSYLVKNGLGYSYDGGTKKKVNWCLDLKTLAKDFAGKSPRHPSSK